MIKQYDQFLSKNKLNEDVADIYKINLPVRKNSVTIANNPTLLKQLVDYDMEAYRNKEKGLSHNLIEELTYLFGGQNVTLRLESMTKLWILEYKDLIFNVYSAKGKGTSIEICGYTSEDIRIGKRQKDISEFLENLYALINNISPEELDLRRTARKYNL